MTQEDGHVHVPSHVPLVTACRGYCGSRPEDGDIGSFARHSDAIEMHADMIMNIVAVMREYSGDKLSAAHYAPPVEFPIRPSRDVQYSTVWRRPVWLKWQTNANSRIDKPVGIIGWGNYSGVPNSEPLWLWLLWSVGKW